MKTVQYAHILRCPHVILFQEKGQFLIWSKSDENDEQLWNIRSNTGALGKCGKKKKKVFLTHILFSWQKIMPEDLFLFSQSFFNMNYPCRALCMIQSLGRGRGVGRNREGIELILLILSLYSMFWKTYITEILIWISYNVRNWNIIEIHHEIR